MQVIILLLGALQSPVTDDWITEPVQKQQSTIETTKKVEFTLDKKELKNKLFVSIFLQSGQYSLEQDKNNEVINLTSQAIRSTNDYFIIFNISEQVKPDIVCGFKSLSELKMLPTINKATPFLAAVNMNGFGQIKLSTESVGYNIISTLKINRGNKKVCEIIRILDLSEAETANIELGSSEVKLPFGIKDHALKIELVPASQRPGQQIQLHIDNISSHFYILSTSKYLYSPTFFKITAQTNVLFPLLTRFRNEDKVVINGFAGNSTGKGSVSVVLE